MESKSIMEPNLSDICVGRCGGVCCDPWWAMISYSAVKKHGASGLDVFEAEILKGIRERGKRVVDNYVTTERPARPLFGQPDKYNVIVKDMKADGSGIRLDLLAMFAFRCAFLSKDKTCSIHPTAVDAGGGTDIRPGRCAQLGSSAAMPGEEGFCRIIHAAPGGDAAVDSAVQMEKFVALKYLSEGFDSPEAAADSVVKKLQEFCSKNAAHLTAQPKRESAGRNDPCPCGSGKKYKKCCGA